MRPQRLVHHRERVRRQLVLAGRDGQQHVITGPQPATTARVSRSPGCQPSTPVMPRSPTRPDSSVRPVPDTTSSGTAGTCGAAARGRRRAVAGLPCSLAPGRARGGISGAISGAVMTASPRGRGRGGQAMNRAACSSGVCCPGNFPCLCMCPRGDCTDKPMLARGGVRPWSRGLTMPADLPAGHLLPHSARPRRPDLGSSGRTGRVLRVLPAARPRAGQARRGNRAPPRR